MNLNIFEKANEITPRVDSFVNDFMKELKVFMRNLEFRTNNMTYAVVSELNERNEYNIAKQEGVDNSMYISAKELPKNIVCGTMLRYKNGKFIIDDDLTRENLSEIKKAKEYRDDLVAQYRMEDTNYLVKSKCEDEVELVNQKTGLLFTAKEFSEETLDKIEKDMILVYKNDEYTIKERSNI